MKGFEAELYRARAHGSVCVNGCVDFGFDCFWFERMEELGVAQWWWWWKKREKRWMAVVEQFC